MVPSLIQKLIPSLKNDDYIMLKKDPGFLEKTSIVCLDCYLLLVD